MRHIVLALIASLFTLPALATPEAIFPGIVNITGVADDDVLNIRQTPDADASIIGRFPHNAAGIEVLATLNGWLRVNFDGRQGWINGRYTVMQPDVWQKDALPMRTVCHGTEPFWSIRLDGDTVQFSTPEGTQGFAGAQVFSPHSWQEDPRRVIAANGLTALISSANSLCSDGMSDMVYGLNIDLVMGEGGAAQYHQGCCSISP